MTVVNPKSISGINSITMASGSDDLLTIHSNNTTERVRVNNSGDVIIGSGVTLSPDGDIFATGITTIGGNVKVGTGVTISPDGDAFFTGVCTATSFSGDGSNLTGLSGVSVANQADNRVITNTGTTDSLNAEANLTFSGSELVADSSMITAQNTGAGSGASKIQLQPYGTDGYINCTASGNLYTRMGTGFTTRTQIDSSGNFTVSSGNLVIGTAGKGVDFSNASGSAAGSASALLDDYEEGTYDGTLSVSSGTLVMNTSLNLVSYTKIGRQVTITGRVNVSSVSGLSGAMTLNLPFTVANSTEADTAGAGSVFMYNAGGVGSPGYLGLWTMWTDGGNSFVYFTYGDGTAVTDGAKVSAGTGVRFTFTFFTS